MGGGRFTRVETMRGQNVSSYALEYGNCRDPRANADAVLKGN